MTENRVNTVILAMFKTVRAERVRADDEFLDFIPADGTRGGLFLKAVARGSGELAADEPQNRAVKGHKATSASCKLTLQGALTRMGRLFGPLFSRQTGA